MLNWIFGCCRKRKVVEKYEECSVCLKKFSGKLSLIKSKPVCNNCAHFVLCPKQLNQFYCSYKNKSKQCYLCECHYNRYVDVCYSIFCEDCFQQFKQSVSKWIYNKVH